MSVICCAALQLHDETLGRAEAEEVLQQTQAALDAMAQATAQSKQDFEDKFEEWSMKLQLEQSAHKSSVTALEQQIVAQGSKCIPSVS